MERAKEQVMMSNCARLVWLLAAITLALAGCGEKQTATPAATLAAAPTAEQTRSAATEPTEKPTEPATALPTPTAGTPEAESVVHIRRFAGQADLTLEKKDTRPAAFGRQVQIYQAAMSEGETARYDVDIDTSEVIGFYRFGQTADTVEVTHEDARSVAESFAREHRSDFDQISAESKRSTLVDLGPGSPKYYSFWWVQMDPISGALLPNEVRIRVNAQTGFVDRYTSLRVQVTVSTIPQIDQQSAVDIALEATEGLESAAVKDAILAVSSVPVYEPDGEQALLWQIAVVGTSDENGYTPGAIVFIDAQSGVIVHVEPFL